MVIVCDEDALVLAMKGLRLKSMAPVPDEQRSFLNDRMDLEHQISVDFGSNAPKFI